MEILLWMSKYIALPLLCFVVGGGFAGWIDSKINGDACPDNFMRPILIILLVGVLSAIFGTIFLLRL